MTRTNRVAPTGEIAALPFRGLFMGNRGVLHDEAGHEHGRVRRPWNLTAWLICATEFRGRKRTLMAPNRYTELFFLDEVHALAAGHRPCFECRRAAYRAFLAAAGHDAAEALDGALHAERLTGEPGMRRASRAPRRHPRPAAGLPDGAMVLVGATVFARYDAGFVAWSRAAPSSYLGGYLARLDGDAERDADALRASLAADGALSVLTPPTTLTALHGGYAPVWHDSMAEAARV